MLRKLIALVLLSVALTSPASAGVTIHYEGTATSPEAIVKILAAVAAFAKKPPPRMVSYSGSLKKKTKITKGRSLASSFA